MRHDRAARAWPRHGIESRRLLCGPRAAGARCRAALGRGVDGRAHDGGSGGFVLPQARARGCPSSPVQRSRQAACRFGRNPPRRPCALREAPLRDVGVAARASSGRPDRMPILGPRLDGQQRSGGVACLPLLWRGRGAGLVAGARGVEARVGVRAQVPAQVAQGLVRGRTLARIGPAGRARLQGVRRPGEAAPSAGVRGHAAFSAGAVRHPAGLRGHPTAPALPPSAGRHRTWPCPPSRRGGRADGPAVPRAPGPSDGSHWRRVKGE
mmetsp:Transcript_19233/g.57533  ORF Transcript_19233/g.57533 Transcript_19233/m.57533 type:complete len:267 (+) Transcript_19233:691-1491(+)